MMGFGFLFMLLFVFLIIGLAVWLISLLFPRHVNSGSAGTSGSTGQRPYASQQELPLDILKKRYARGEITRAEYEEMRSEILGVS